MKQVNLLPLFMLCSLAPIAQATIVSIEKWHNPETNQSIVLMNDVHFILPEVDDTQCDALVKKITALQAPLITESYPTEALTGYSTEANLVLNTLLINRLHKAYKQQGGAVHGIEFRKSYADLVGLFIRCRKSYTTYDDLMASLNDPKVAQLVHKLLYGCWMEGDDLFDDIVPYVQNIPKRPDYTKKDQAYLKLFDELLGAYANDGGNVFFKALDDRNNKELQGPMEFFFNDKYIKNEDGSFSNNPKSLWRLTEDSLDKLFDAHILKKLHELKKDPVIFVHAGQYHVQHFATEYLPRLGFIATKKSSCQEYTPLMPLANLQADSLETLLQSEERKKILASVADYQSHFVDVTSFMEQ